MCFYVNLKYSNIIILEVIKRWRYASVDQCIDVRFRLSFIHIWMKMIRIRRTVTLHLHTHNDHEEVMWAKKNVYAFRLHQANFLNRKNEYSIFILRVRYAFQWQNLFIRIKTMWRWHRAKETASACLFACVYPFRVSSTCNHQRRSTDVHAGRRKCWWDTQGRRVLPIFQRLSTIPCPCPCIERDAWRLPATVTIGNRWPTGIIERKYACCIHFSDSHVRR